MIYYVTAQENNKSKLIVKTMNTTDKFTAEAVADIWECEGYIVITKEEE